MTVSGRFFDESDPEWSVSRLAAERQPVCAAPTGWWATWRLLVGVPVALGAVAAPLGMVMLGDPEPQASRVESLRPAAVTALPTELPSSHVPTPTYAPRVTLMPRPRPRPRPVRRVRKPPPTAAAYTRAPVYTPAPAYTPPPAPEPAPTRAAGPRKPRRPANQVGPNPLVDPRHPIDPDDR